MPDLKDALDTLYELNGLRDRAKELREQGRLALKEIKNTRVASSGKDKSKSAGKGLREEWIKSGNSVEAALLVKVQNHRDLSDDENENDISEAGSELTNRLINIKLKDLFPPADNETPETYEDRGDRDIPVLVAARVMQALVTRSKTVFSKATLLCYYRIVRELYIAAPPDWTIGAARAGTGGNTSAFITGECIRAIFAFNDSIKSTATFFEKTHRLLGRYELLNEMLNGFGHQPLPENNAKAGRTKEVGKAHGVNNEVSPIHEWADRAIERMWFDWYISTNPRHVNMALHLGKEGNQLLFHPTEQVDMKAVGEYRRSLRGNLKRAVEEARRAIISAKREIQSLREDQGAFLKDKPSAEERHAHEKEARDYYRAESAHRFAFSLIEKAEEEVERAAAFFKKDSIKDILEEFKKQFEEIPQVIRRVLEPAKRYIRTVLHREVASTAFGRFDAGELVFAAASFGAMTDWKPSEYLTRACDLLIEALPESGRLPTIRPFHSTRRGHRMLPIGCEMTRSLAQLIQKINYEIDPKLVRRMLNIFEEKLIPLDTQNYGDGKKRVAWNFEGSPDSNRPCVWVTSVSILAIDRVARMLNERINSIIFKYFEVIRPEKPHSSLTLNDLFYSDYGLSKYHDPTQPAMALRLEQMRAHAMRVTLPEMYRDERGKKERMFSAIFYGPPGTGKTTLVEALALSSDLPLIRLSPSDLVVQGPAEIEGRARTVFEALSMLTQAIIIFDEFEVVVGQRGQAAAGTQHKDEDIFEFLRTGMLPKLLKLHDSAGKQSLVYCLATNHFWKIDPAARRKGRFDLHLPVYDPDSLSRAGTLLYRLRRVIQRLDNDERLNSGSHFSPTEDGLPLRFMEVVEKTRDVRASSLAEDYLRLPEWVIDHESKRPDKYQEEIPCFWYILEGGDKGWKRKENLLDEERQKARKEQKEIKRSENEEKEHAWLEHYEALLGKTLEKERKSSTKTILSCLIGVANSQSKPVVSRVKKRPQTNT
jgi:hypothetical protein